MNMVTVTFHIRKLTILDEEEEEEDDYGEEEYDEEEEVRKIKIMGNVDF